MAHLGRKCADGTPAWNRYVQTNPNWDTFPYLLEDSTTLLPLDSKSTSGQTGLALGPGHELHILSPEIVIVSGVRMAQVEADYNERGLVPIQCIKKPSGYDDGTHFEEAAVDRINAFIVDADGKVDLHIGTDLYTNVVKAVKVSGEMKRLSKVKCAPKADIVLLGDRNIYISHKKAGGARAFQQYAGISPMAGDSVYNNVLVQRFRADVAQEMDSNGGKLVRPIMAEYDDPTLSCQAIFGPSFGTDYGLDHCTLIGQGVPQFDRLKDGTFEFTFSDHMSLSADLGIFTGNYEPVFAATYRQGRSFTHAGTLYNNVRLGIYPLKTMLVRRGVLRLGVYRHGH